ncbi:MAG: hypothetical protein SF066_06040 [Thermoanaerobaculia bacterium]|nr:hypothetical protein [Thermoanaerobaculia bacterium]
MRDELSAVELKAIIWHLLEVCPECAQAAEESWVLALDGVAEPACERLVAFEGPAVGELSFERVRRRVHSTLSRLEAERAHARELARELDGLPVEHLCMQLRNNPRFASLPLCDLLLEKAWELGLVEPKAGLMQIEALIELSSSIEASLFGHELRHELLSRAWAYRGNFLRILNDFRLAEAAFAQSELHLNAGTGDLLEKARFLSLKASLRRSQRRLDEANDLLQRSVAIYLGTDEDHLAGRAMISQAGVAFEQGNPAKSANLVKHALTLIDPAREPRLVLVSQQNLVLDLTEMGLYQEAVAMLPKTRRLSIEYGSRFDLLRFRWLEGSILQGLGHDARAEAAFLEVRKGFLEEELGYDAALVSLNLASLYARQGRIPELKRLTLEMVPIFESREVHREALTALLLFQKAVEMETVTVRMVEEVATYLRRSQHEPRLRFEEPS